MTGGASHWPRAALWPCLALACNSSAAPEAAPPAAVECSPQIEVCNGADDDCDGSIDEDATCPGKGEVCSDGRCGCPPEHWCDGHCVDPLHDDAHCGACDSPCPAHGYCVEGTCQCPPGLIVCAGACTCPLYDAEHCGSCDVACPAGPSEVATCLHGTCGVAERVADTPTFPRGIAVDATHVYWAEVGGRVLSIAKSGGTPAVLATLGYSPGDVGVDGVSVYWTSDDPAATESAAKVLKAGGAPQALAPEGGAFTLALDDAHLNYVTRFREIASVGLDGSNPRILWTPDPYDSTIGPDRIGLAADETGVYHVISGMGCGPECFDTLLRVYRTPVDGVTELLFEGSGLTANAALDASHVYWLNGEVRAMPKDGGSPSGLGGIDATIALSVLGAFVYTVEQDCRVGTLDETMQITRRPITGGAATVLATGHPSDLAVDEDFVYWTDWAVSAVLRVPR